MKIIKTIINLIIVLNNHSEIYNVFVGNDAVNGTKNQPSVNDVAGDSSNVPETVAQITKELKII